MGKNRSLGRGCDYCPMTTCQPSVRNQNIKYLICKLLKIKLYISYKFCINVITTYNLANVR